MNIYFGITFQIRKYRCLWDTNSSKNEDRNVRSNAWNELSDVFNKEGKQKKKHLRLIHFQFFSLTCYAVFWDIVSIIYLTWWISSALQIHLCFKNNFLKLFINTILLLFFLFFLLIRIMFIEMLHVFQSIRQTQAGFSLEYQSIHTRYI